MLLTPTHKIPDNQIFANIGKGDGMVLIFEH